MYDDIAFSRQASLPVSVALCLGECLWHAEWRCAAFIQYREGHRALVEVHVDILTEEAWCEHTWMLLAKQSEVGQTNASHWRGE